MFAIRQNVVYPGHGVAQITDIVEKVVGGFAMQYYQVTFLHKDATVLVPVCNAEDVGLRELGSQDDVAVVFERLTLPARKLSQYEFTASSWNRRNKEYQSKMRSGSLQELSEIYRDLRYIATQKELSFGEKSLLGKAEALLVEEIALVQEVDSEKVMEKLRMLCRSYAQQCSL